MKYLHGLRARLSVLVFFTIAVQAAQATTAAIAFTFGQKTVDQRKFVAIAAPLKNDDYKLLIIEQLSKTKDCWRTQGQNPIKVDPLFMKFDFTGICARSADSNGYSVRYGGQDLALNYILTIKRRGNELVLLGIPRPGRKGQILEIGRTRGIAAGYTQIMLNPGWKFTRRTFKDKSLGHIYFTKDQPSSSASIATPE